MTGQICSRCGAAVIRGTCTLCGLPAGATAQPAPFNPAGFAAAGATSFGPLEDTAPDLPIVPGFDATLPAAPAPAGYWGSVQPVPPGPGSWPAAPGGSPYGASPHSTPRTVPNTVPAYTGSPYGAQVHGAGQSGPPAYYASQPVGAQPPSGGGRRLALIVAVGAAILLGAGAIGAAVGLWGPTLWFAAKPTPSATVIPAPSAQPASTVTVTVAPPPPATTRATTRPPTTTQARPTTPSAQAVTSLPAGSWITILESLPKGEYSLTQAQAQAAGLGGRGPKVSVIDSDAIPGLNGGYWALGVTGHGSRESAVGSCGAFGREAGGSCYPREVG